MLICVQPSAPVPLGSAAILARQSIYCVLLLLSPTTLRFSPQTELASVTRNTISATARLATWRRRADALAAENQRRFGVRAIAGELDEVCLRWYIEGYCLEVSAHTMTLICTPPPQFRRQ